MSEILGSRAISFPSECPGRDRRMNLPGLILFQPGRFRFIRAKKGKVPIDKYSFFNSRICIRFLHPIGRLIQILPVYPKRRALKAEQDRNESVQLGKPDARGNYKRDLDWKVQDGQYIQHRFYVGQDRRLPCSRSDGHRQAGRRDNYPHRHSRWRYRSFPWREPTPERR